VFLHLPKFDLEIKHLFENSLLLFSIVITSSLGMKLTAKRFALLDLFNNLSAEPEKHPKHFFYKALHFLNHISSFLQNNYLSASLKQMGPSSFLKVFD
jgi:hypothetical protein